MTSKKDSPEIAKHWIKLWNSKIVCNKNHFLSTIKIKTKMNFNCKEKLLNNFTFIIPEINL